MEIFKLNSSTDKMPQSWYQEGAHCSYCGEHFQDSQWPKTCSQCKNVAYRNPIPVAVVILPVDDGIIVIRRSIPPKIGELALPGGFINLGESWQTAASRELLEETGIEVSETCFTIFKVASTPDNSKILLFCALPFKLNSNRMPNFKPTDETTERLLLTGPQELAFPLHTQAVKEFFDLRKGA